MSDLLPLFPLPNVVLFPNVFLPLHIFEPRYREMIADALAGDRLIGMVLLRPGWDAHYEGRPAVYPIGCAGVITHVDRLEDGRYNVVLRGLDRFRVIEEEHSRSYRRARVETVHDQPLAGDDRQTIQNLRIRLEAMVGKEATTSAARIPTTMADEELINALAQYMSLEPVEKQALLEQPCLRSRASSLVELLEMKTLMARNPGRTAVAH